MTTSSESPERISHAWSPDPELDSFEILTLELPELETHAGEAEGSLRATIVRRNEPSSRKAMLYVHGWNDYFFQRHLADAMAELGYDFYALDLHRYGRSLRPGHLAGFTTDLTEYFGELDETADIIADEGHDELVVMAHSTGGLVTALWADANPGRITALLLNSPWLELQGYPALRPAIQLMLSAARQVSPTAALPVSDTGFYRRTISALEEGEWDYNHDLKGNKSFMVRIGWLSAVMAGHARVADGLGIDVPVFVAISARSDFSRRWREDFRRADIVLDVDRLAERASQLGSHVTLVRVADGMHDLALSDEPARTQFLHEVTRWLRAYG